MVTVNMYYLPVQPGLFASDRLAAHCLAGHTAEVGSNL